jgi:hypothetical protein
MLDLPSMNTSSPKSKIVLYLLETLSDTLGYYGIWYIRPYQHVPGGLKCIFYRFIQSCLSRMKGHLMGLLAMENIPS